MVNKKKTKLITAVLIVAILLALITDLLWGSTSIPYKEGLKILLGNSTNASWRTILLDFRLPRALSAFIIGGSLSLAGLMMQTFFRNPLAGPFVLGISSGASLGVALFIMMGSIFPVLGAWAASSGGQLGMVAFAIGGAFLVFSLVVVVSLRINSTASLLIVGMMFGSITGAVVSLLQFFSNPNEIQAFLMWTFGSLNSISWSELKILFPIILVGTLCCVFLQKSFNALLLGDNHSKTIGVHIKRTRLLTIISTCVIAGTITAFAGPIAFIGVAVPHLARYVMKSSDHKILLPIVFLMGALLLVICDIISQMPWSSSVLPINSVCALFGAPVIILVVLRHRKMQINFI